MRSQRTRPFWLRRDRVRCHKWPTWNHQRRAVHGHSLITNVSTDNRTQPLACFRNGVVHASPELSCYLAQLGLQTLAHRFVPGHEAYQPSRLPAFDRAQKLLRREKI